jgi:hypothetical protein
MLALSGAASAHRAGGGAMLPMLPQASPAAASAGAAAAAAGLYSPASAGGGRIGGRSSFGSGAGGSSGSFDAPLSGAGSGPLVNPLAAWDAAAAGGGAGHVGTTTQGSMGGGSARVFAQPLGAIGTPSGTGTALMQQGGIPGFAICSSPGATLWGAAGIAGQAPSPLAAAAVPTPSLQPMPQQQAAFGGSGAAEPPAGPGLLASGDPIQDLLQALTLGQGQSQGQCQLGEGPRGSAAASPPADAPRTNA